MTWHEILGVLPSAKPDEIIAAYRKLALTRHPDRGGSAEAFQEIKNARDEGLSWDGPLLAITWDIGFVDKRSPQYRRLLQLNQQAEIVEARVKLWDPADPRIEQMRKPIRDERAEILKLLESRPNGD